LHFPETWLPGDILAFSGRGCVSMGIKIGTCSTISHVGMVAYVRRHNVQFAATMLARRAEAQAVGDAKEFLPPVPQIKPQRIANWVDRFLLFESTTLAMHVCEITGHAVKGVQAHEPEGRIATYDGTVRLFRLREEWWHALKREDEDRLAEKLLSRIGHKYDGRGAILSGTNVVKHWFPYRRFDRSSLFCSEYLAETLQHLNNIFPATNASKWTPKSLVNWLCDTGRYEEWGWVKR
jgi:hypothetical protein